MTFNGPKISPVRLLKWMTNLAIFVYIIVLFILIFKGGFDYRIFGIQLRANSPVQSFGIFILLILLRVLVGMEMKNVWLVVGAAGLSLLISEGLLRYLDLPAAREPELKKSRRLTEVLGWENVPLLAGKGSLGIDIQINSHGLRDVERSWDKPEGVFRILALGDSFTYGYARELADTYVKQLESLLNTGAQKVDVINAGVTHYNLYQCLTYFKYRGIRYQPDLVIYFFYLDDVSSPHGPEEMKRVYQVLLKKESATRSDAALSNIYSINFIKNTKVLLDARLRPFIGAQWLRSIEKRREHLEMYIRFWSEKHHLEPFKAHLQELKHTVEKINADLLVVLIPDAVQIHEPSAQQINKTLQDMCSDLAIPFMDITPLFEKQADVRSLYLFPVDAHTSPKGDRLIAAAVYEKIREAGFHRANPFGRSHEPWR